MIRRVLLLLLPLAAAMLAAARSDAQPTRESLLAAWEQLQSGDPQVEVFEPVGEGLYRFHTSRFPFQGELRVTNVSINADSSAGITGAVEVELIGVAPDFYDRHAFSYSAWAENNILDYDAAGRRWLTAAEWNELAAASPASRADGEVDAADTVLDWGGRYWMPLVLAVLGGFVLLMALASAARARRLQAESVELLREIRNLLDDRTRR